MSLRQTNVKCLGLILDIIVRVSIIKVDVVVQITQNVQGNGQMVHVTPLIGGERVRGGVRPWRRMELELTSGFDVIDGDCAASVSIVEGLVESFVLWFVGLCVLLFLRLCLAFARSFGIGSGSGDGDTFRNLSRQGG